MSTLYSCCKIRRVEVTTFKALLGYKVIIWRHVGGGGGGGGAHYTSLQLLSFLVYGVVKSVVKKVHFFYTFLHF